MITRTIFICHKVPIIGRLLQLRTALLRVVHVIVLAVGLVMGTHAERVLP